MIDDRTQNAIKVARKDLEQFLRDDIEAGETLNWAEMEATLPATIAFLHKDNEWIPETDAQARIAAALWLERDNPVLAHVIRQGIPKPRRHRLMNRPRDIRIGMAVYLVAKLGFAPTRNNASRHKDGAAESACSIVAKALAEIGIHMTEDAVVKIWKNLAYLRDKS